MKKLTILASFFILLSCGYKVSDTKPESFQQAKVIEVGINETIETFMIVRSISDNDPLFQHRDQKYKGKPMMYEARKFFADYKNHLAVSATMKMLNETSSTGDLILQGLLYFEELPSKRMKYTITSEYWESRKDSLTEYINVLHQFYMDANVSEFLSNNSYYYDGAIAEAKSYLDDNLISTMEGFFGIENYAYKMLLIPNSPFGMGFGASVKSEHGDIFYQIISPSNDIEWKDNSLYDSYGYSGEGAKEYYRDMVVHEFCHPFITPYLESEQIQKEIAKYDSLFVKSLELMMKEQGYGSWWGYVNEHLVRLGEIRVAAAMGIQDLDEMRRINTEENGFILLPEAEKLVIQYENNREVYPTFHDFIPVLIKQFETFDKQQIKTKLEHHKAISNSQ